MVKHTSVRLILAMVALYDLELEQLDVKTAFLHSNLDERIYMEQPTVFYEGRDREDGVFVAKVFVWAETIPKAVVQKI